MQGFRYKDGWRGGGKGWVAMGIDLGYSNTALRNNLKSHSVVSFFFCKDECTSFWFFFASFLFIILLIYRPEFSIFLKNICVICLCVCADCECVMVNCDVFLCGCVCVGWLILISQQKSSGDPYINTPVFLNLVLNCICSLCVISTNRNFPCLE